MVDKKIGNYSFIGGVGIAVILGLALPIGDTIKTALTSVLVLLGLIVGFLNVVGKETKEFLLIAAVLVIAAGVGQASTELGSVQIIGPYLSGIFQSIMLFVVPATVIVGLKDIYALAQG